MNKRLADHTRARLTTAADSGGIALELAPRNLLGAVWLQLARAVDENKSYRRCRGCARWYELVREGGRVTRLFCSNACRGKAYRTRQDRARRMHSDGKTYESIAEELDSDVATVRRWVTGRGD